MSRPKRASIPLATLLLAAAANPSATQQREQDPDPVERAATALDAWLDSKHDDGELVDAAVSAILDAERPGLAVLARAIDRERDRRRRRALDSALTRVGLGFIERQQETGIAYAGQFDPLEVLMPAVGRFYQTLVLDTPDWFPDTMRILVVPALRDLYPKGPDQDSIEALRQIAVDEDFETESLRLSLICALHQWGQPDLADRRIQALKRAAGARETADQLYFVRELARFFYQLRDYETAAADWRAYLRGIEALDAEPPALDYYNAACSLSLAGLLDEALSELERCTAMIAEGRTNTAAEFSRKMFELDPDLRAIRSTKRFEKAVDDAFPAKQRKKRP